MSNQADTAIRFALAQVGKPYVWGATGPNSYDCSGLTYAAYKAAGVTLLRTTYLQVTQGSAVDIKSLQPGDLIFPDPGHVQLFIGNGQVVEAPQAGENVRVTTMWGFWKARRITAPGSVGSAADTAAPYPPGTLKAPLTTAQRTAVLAYMKPHFSQFGGDIVDPSWADFSKWDDPGIINEYNASASSGTVRTGDLGEVTPGIGPTPSIGDMFTVIKNFIDFLTNPHNWLRIGMFTLGLLFLAIALIATIRSNAAQVAKGIIS